MVRARAGRGAIAEAVRHAVGEAAEPAAIGLRHARPPNRKRARPTWAAAASLQLVRKAAAACVPRIPAAAIRLNKTIPMSERAREPAAATLRHGRAARPQSACRTWGVAAVRQLVRVRHQRVDRATQHGPAATVRARAIAPAPAGRNCPAPVAVVRAGVQAMAEILLAAIDREGINPAITGRAEASREPVDRAAVVPLRATLATSSAFLAPCSRTSVRANPAPIVRRSIVRRVPATVVDPVARAPIDRAPATKIVRSVLTVRVDREANDPTVRTKVSGLVAPVLGPIDQDVRTRAIGPAVQVIARAVPETAIDRS